MDTPFSFDKIAAGNSIIGRESELHKFVEVISGTGKGLAIYSGPRSGKETVVREGLSRLNSNGFPFKMCELNLFNVRSLEDFIKAFKDCMAGCFKDISSNSLLSFDFNLDSLSNKQILNLPSVIASEASTTLIIYIKEFQNLLTIEDGERFSLELLEKIWSKHTNVKYIFTGSFVNSMKEIFEERKLFFQITEILDLKPLSRKDVCEYITSSFLNVGRVIEMEEALTIYEMADGNMWYIKQFCSFCNSLPVGYINRRIVNRVKDMLFSIHCPRFTRIMLDITQNQINLLQAVVDEVPRFSSSEVLEKYQLNSSANVARIKDALQKREILAFDGEDRPYFIDPLFRYWLKHYYFAK